MYIYIYIHIYIYIYIAVAIFIADTSDRLYSGAGLGEVVTGRSLPAANNILLGTVVNDRLCTFWQTYHDDLMSKHKPFRVLYRFHVLFKAIKAM